jgi:hypothetical protein
LNGKASDLFSTLNLTSMTTVDVLIFEDAAKRALEFHRVDQEESLAIHTTSTLKQFIEFAHDPTVCGNLLDMKAEMAPMAGLIVLVAIIFLCHEIAHMMHRSRLADDRLAWNITHQECHAHMPARPSIQRGKGGSLPTTATTEQPLVGPQTIRYDTGSMLRWSLLTHGGYVTYPHKDANGLCTWIFAQTGIKIWAILDPSYVSPDHHKRSAQFGLHSKMMYAPLRWDFEEHSGRYSVFLAPGDMLWVPLAALICHMKI